MPGKVYIASMNMRGTWADRPDNTIILNVTSMQGKTKDERKDFSPMSEIQGGYKDFYCFENYWQSGKVFQDFDNEKVKKWWNNLKQGKRRYPGSKGVKVLYSDIDGKQRDYIQSRKEIYVPEYYELMSKTQSLTKWKTLVDSGKNVVVYDFDGPRDDNYNPICLEVNLDLLKNKINYVNHPFGHGYVVASALLGIHPKDYVM